MRLPRSIVYPCFSGWYRLKIGLLRPLLGDETIAVVLYSSWFPHLVLRIGRASLGPEVRVSRWLSIHESRGSFRNLKVGEKTYLGKHLLIDLTSPVTIGARCAIGMNVRITTHLNFGDSVLSQANPPEQAEVCIGDDAVINWGCILLKGTAVGERAVVLPGSVVSGRLRSGAKYIGNPARTVPAAQPQAA